MNSLSLEIRRVGRPSLPAHRPRPSRASRLGFRRVKRGPGRDSAHPETLCTGPPSAVICWTPGGPTSPCGSTEMVALPKGNLGYPHDKHLSGYLDKQKNTSRDPSLRGCARSLQAFGIDQRRLLKHPGSNSIRPALSYRTTCCSSPWTVSFLDPHTDDAASNPQNALTCATFSWLICSALWSGRCSECSHNSMVMIPGHNRLLVRGQGSG